MTLPKNKSILIAIIIAVSISLWLASGVFNEKPVIAAKSVVDISQTKEIKVQVTTLQATDHADVIDLFGQTREDRRVDIKAETAGRIEEILLAKGAFVKQGDVIARIRLEDRQHRLKSAQANVRFRNMEYEASRKLSQKSFRSQTKLAEAESLLNAARAELKTARMDLEHIEIKAPFDGKLDDKSIEVGDFVSVGTVVARIVDLSPIIVEAEIPEKDILKVTNGQPARAYLSDGMQIDGIIRYVASTSDKSTRTFKIEMAGNNDNHDISAGLTANLKLHVGHNAAFKVSPAILTLSEKGEIGLKTVNKNNTVEFYKVNLLEDTPQGIWVSGLPETARIITRGQEYVNVGQTVVPIELNAETETKLTPALVKAEGQ